MSRRRSALALTLALPALTAGCGGHARSKNAGAGPAIPGTIRLADCNAWRFAPRPERLATIAQLRAFYGGDVTAGSANGAHGPGPVLPDARAYRLLDSYCALPFASAFKLYKIYGRAAGFAAAGR